MIHFGMSMELGVSNLPGVSQLLNLFHGILGL